MRNKFAFKKNLFVLKQKRFVPNIPLNVWSTAKMILQYARKKKASVFHNLENASPSKMFAVLKFQPAQR